MSQLSITIIQTDLKWEDKEANLQMLEKKIMGIAGKPEIVVLPEMFSTGFTMRPAVFAETMDGRSVQWMKRVAKEKRIVLTGSLIIEEDGNYYNRLIWMLPNGEYGIYDKRHRFALGGEHEEFSAGDKRLIASVKGWKINLLICYDLRFPIWARQQPKEGAMEYDLLIYVANWPETRIQAWKILLQARAIENQAYVVGVNRVGIDGHGKNHSGDSMVCDALGNILHQKTGEEDIFTITIDRSPMDEVREKLPFWQDADSFLISDVHLDVSRDTITTKA